MALCAGETLASLSSFVAVVVVAVVRSWASELTHAAAVVEQRLAWASEWVQVTMVAAVPQSPDHRRKERDASAVLVVFAVVVVVVAVVVDIDIADIVRRPSSNLCVCV